MDVRPASFLGQCVCLLEGWAGWTTSSHRSVASARSPNRRGGSCTSSLSRSANRSAVTRPRQAPGRPATRSSSTWTSWSRRGWSTPSSGVCPGGGAPGRDARPSCTGGPTVRSRSPCPAALRTGRADPGRRRQRRRPRRHPRPRGGAARGGRDRAPARRRRRPAGRLDLSRRSPPTDTNHGRRAGGSCSRTALPCRGPRAHRTGLRHEPAPHHRLLDELGHPDVHPRLDPATDRCCVTLTDEPAAWPSGR